MSWNIEKHEFKSISIHMKLIRQECVIAAFKNNIQIPTVYINNFIEENIPWL